MRRSHSLLILLLFVFVGCSTKPPSRYALEHDVEPQGQFDVTGVPYVEPSWEPLSPQGNRSPYSVNGQSYQVMSADEGYSEEGVASWYGLKFHGELTSNGEIYDMYSYSAAHKSLPLPSFVKVKNLENGRSLVVRVNDRGPFHGDRIIDLSYAAAIKLGYKDKGTAKVSVEKINFSPAKRSAPDVLAPFVQVAAFSNLQSAKGFQRSIEKTLGVNNVFVADSMKGDSKVFRVRVGPFESKPSAMELIDRLLEAGLGQPQLISRSLSAPNS